MALEPSGRRWEIFIPIKIIIPLINQINVEIQMPPYYFFVKGFLLFLMIEQGLQLIYNIPMLGQTKKSSSIRKSAKLPKLNIQQHIENQQIADRMNRKITFARNPRHLTQTMSYASAFATESQQTKFRVDPEQLYFSNYDVMHIYESEVKLINNSKYIQRIKVAPLKQKEFVLADIRYPRQDCGDIAPGMSVTITIRFRPASLSDYQDDLIVIVGDGVVKVPIIAQRQRCEINWPKSIACGHCWVGDVIKKQIVLKNKGGEAEFLLFNSQGQKFKVGYFSVSPLALNFEKNTQKVIIVEFVPEKQGVFKQSIKYKSLQGDQEEVQIVLQGGAYSAQIVLQQLNGEKLIQQRMHNTLYIKDTEMGKQATASLKIRNLAVVQVDYFWYYASKNLTLDKTKGKMKPSQILPVQLSLTPQQKTPQSIVLQLYLFNLPQKSLSANLVTKNINGIEAIQCLTIQIKTKPAYSNIQVFPLHREIIQPIFQNCSVEESITIVNNSPVKRTFHIDKIKIDQGLNATPLELDGVLEPNTTKIIPITFYLSKLTSSIKNAYFLVSFDNAESQIFSICGRSTFPDLDFKQQILYFGLCKTYTLNKKNFTLYNNQKTPVQFKIHNNNRFYVLQFYDFYEFEDQQSYKRRFNVYDPTNGKQILDWVIIPPHSQIHLDCLLNVLDEESIELQIQLEIKNGKKTQVKIIGEVQDVKMQMSRSLISMRQIYKGNIYNSNKFLSKELQIINTGNHDCVFEIIQPSFQECQVRIQPKHGIVKPKSTQRIDMILQPIKTGDFDLKIYWNHYDDFKQNPDLYLEQVQVCRFNSVEGAKSMIKHNQLQITGTIKGMAMNYYLKDQSRVKKVRQKIQDVPQSIKLSSSSFNPSMSMKSNKNLLLQNQKLVYPLLEELNFYNCQINQVRQVQIIIQNDSGLTTQYEVYAEQYRTLEKYNELQRKNQKGLVKVDEEPFTSQMGKTYIKSKALDRSQKVHLGNNKGISVLCQPASGALHKKQTQKILITMFNDTSGRFKDNLIINVKNHQIKKIPMDIHIKGTPVSLSRNQLGIDFNQEIPFMNLGTLLHSNGLIKRTIKVVNNGPKEVELKWLIYPYNKQSKDKDIFNIEFKQAAPGNGNIIDLNWNANKPQIDQSSYLSLQPKQKRVKGREQINFTVLIQEIKQVGSFSNLLICEPYIIDGANKTPMQSLAVVVATQTISPQLTMDLKHKNHINKLQKFAIPHQQYQTNANNFIRKLKLKNTLKTNLTFDISIQSKDKRFQSFKIVEAKTNSPATNLLATSNQRSFCLTYDSIVEVTVELMANQSNLNDWPMEEKVRKQGQIAISFSNGSKQAIQLAGWLYRPWLVIQMPNQKLYSNENFQIDFGTVHYKNSKKLSFYLINPSKVDAKYTIAYIKYHQSIKYKFEQTLWTALDYQDQSITDEKKCWKLSLDSGVVKNRSVPVHYMPATLALPSADDQFAETHKPHQVTIMFKPETNVLYKSKFRLTVTEGLTFDIVVKGRGSYEEQLQKK